MCEPRYRRYRIDDHIYDIYNLLAYLGYRRVTYLEDVVFEHQNYEDEHGQDGQVFRSSDQRVYVPDQSTIEADAALFDSLFAERKWDALQPQQRLLANETSLSGKADIAGYFERQ